MHNAHGQMPEVRFHGINLFCRTGSTNVVCITMSNKNSDATTYVVLQETQCQLGISNYPISEVHINKSDLIFPIIGFLPPKNWTQKNKIKITGKVGQ